MGYACPVCDTPQADAGHLANHLAFTALARGGDHETWLDEHVPKWDHLGESELAAEVTPKAEEATYPQVFEARNVEDGTDVDPAVARERGREEVNDAEVSDDAEVREILNEARSLTEEMLDDSDDDGDDAESNADAGEQQVDAGER